MSDFSAVHLGRPGLGDKMFDSAADHGPLASISASPPESDASQRRFGRRNSFDSIMDEEQRFSMEDSIFEKTGQPISVSDDLVFGDDYSHLYRSGLYLHIDSARSLCLVLVACIAQLTMISASSFKPQCVCC